jgi:ADP-ribose pyrophosphatase
VTHEFAVRARHERFRGSVFSVVTDEVAMPGGRYADRDYAVHIGAVAVAAVDESDRVVLVRQYRHPVGRELWELPAGLIDVAGEELPAAAARELAEEADLAAASWQLLLDLHTSPGYSTEVVRVYLARDLTDIPVAARHHRENEEAVLTCQRVPLDEAVAMTLRGEITNASAVAGILAAARVRDAGWPPPARPLDAALPGRRSADMNAP